MTAGKTIAEWVVDHGGYHDEGTIEKVKELKIVKEYDGTEFAFPQSRYNHRNVYVWVLLEDGSSVGFNESPRSGVSFPRTGKKTTDKYLEFFKTKEN